MPLILGANSLTGGYEVDNSLRFNSGSSDNLNRTPATTTNRKTATLSFWIKKSKTIAENDELFSFGLFSSASTRLYFRDGADLNKLALDNYNGTSFTLGFSTNQLFRDYSAWYHIVLAIDTTQATDTNRLKLYVNGEQVTSFASINYGSLNEDLSFNNTSSVNYIGRNHQPKYFDGYMSEVNFIDGQQLTPTDFGEFDEDSGIWKPIAYTGTYGTNGFYLEFKDSSALGDDTSGNGNDFTVNNLTSIDQTTDTPTNNFATLNSLSTNSNITLSEGNLKAASSFTSDNIPSYGTIGVTTGKWYWEVKLSAATFNTGSGIAGVLGGTNIDFSTGYRAGLAGIQIATATNGTIQNDNVNTSNYFGGAISNGDILGVALDATNKQLKFNLNGGSFGSDLNFNASYTLFIPATDVRASSGTPAVEFNFGNPPFTISSGNSDANGFGNFEYSVPSGYFSLCTKNLAEYG
jgi:hypothetical protein